MPSNQTLAHLTIPRNDAIEKLRDRITKGRQLKHIKVKSFDYRKSSFMKWEEFNYELLRRIFTTQQYYDDYTFGRGGINSVDELIYQIDKCIERLESLLERVESDLIPVAKGVTIMVSSNNSNSVFIVHGHDEAAREGVARFIEKLALKAIILHEQPSKGQTVIEKFEKEAENVGYAIVLMTPDDLGNGVTKANEPQSRARQNVIYELGYFCGKLGRGRVCMLTKGDIEIPSDLAGIVYISMNGDWKLQLAKEMKAVGLAVDMNKAFD